MEEYTLDMIPRTSRTIASAAVLAGVLLAGAPPVMAHEIPARVTVVAFVKPLGQTLRVAIRVPLEAMRDVEFPLRGMGFLDFDAIGPRLHEAARLWIAGSLGLLEDGRPLPEPRVVAVQISLPSDRSFETWEAALAHITGPPLPRETELVWQQALLDVILESPVASDRSDFSLRPTLARLGIQTTTVVRFQPPTGPERAYQYIGDPGLVRLDPRWHHAVWQFVELGFRHILDGTDHLLFLLCLVLPFRRVRPLVLVVTSFTVAHSITLIAASTGLAPSALWFPPLIEALIGLSILFMAFENIVGARRERRWLLAFGFGLVHGFGFSFFLRESLQFAGGHLVTSLLAFNVGVELGQLLVVVLVVPVLAVLLSRVVKERIGIILISALVAHSAWHWMTDRVSALRQYRFQWPVLDSALLGAAWRALLLLVIVAGAGWALLGLARRLAPAEPPGEPEVSGER